MAEVKIVLADEQEGSLKNYVYEITREAITQARKDAGIDKDLVNKKEICEFLDCSFSTLGEWMKQGLPYSVLGERTYYFSKQEVRKWILSYNKK